MKRIEIAVCGIGIRRRRERLALVRTHLSLEKNAPDFRHPQKLGRVASISILGGLRHQYVRV